MEIVAGIFNNAAVFSENSEIEALDPWKDDEGRFARGRRQLLEVACWALLKICQTLAIDI